MPKNNQFVSNDVIADMALMDFKNNFLFRDCTYNGYRDDLNQNGNGGTIRIKRPINYRSQSGKYMDAKPIEESTTSLRITNHEHVAIEMDSYAFSLGVQDPAKFNREYIQPMTKPLLEKVEASIAAQYYKLSHALGDGSSIPQTYEDVSEMDVLMDDMAFPTHDRKCIANPRTISKMASQLFKQNTFSSEGATKAYRKSFVGDVANMHFLKSNHVPTHTNGDARGAPKIKGANQAVKYEKTEGQGAQWQTLITTGWDTTKTLKKGDIITIEGVEMVNPSSFLTTDRLQTFTILEDVTTSGSGTGDTVLKISPAMITGELDENGNRSPYQTVTAAPANNAAITVKGAAGEKSKQNLFLHPNAIAFSMADILELPPQFSAGMNQSTKSEDGLSFTFSTGGNIQGLSGVARLDCCWAVDVLDPRLGGRYFSALT